VTLNSRSPDTVSHKGSTGQGRYTIVAAGGPLLNLDRIIRPHGWRSAIERAVILVVIVGVVVGLLILASRHDLSVYSNIVGGNGE
jgi:hypothetical protein